MDKKLEAIMKALRKHFWPAAKPTQKLNENVNPRLRTGGIPDDEMFILYVLKYANEIGVDVEGIGGWPEGWLDLTAEELAAEI